MSTQNQSALLIGGLIFLIIATTLFYVSQSNPSGLQSRAFVSPDDRDDDLDGLSNREESEYLGTDPMNPDTDGDGAYDGFEFFVSKSDPLSP
jgi:hypothetical protein